jgi:SAM-dependent methyltransferase
MTADLLWQNLMELPYFRATLRAVEGRLLSDINLPEPILDLGCGDGHFASVTYDVKLDIGLDPEIRALREAQQRSSYHLLLQAQGHRIPVANHTFSSAISNSVLEHIPGIEFVLSEISRVLKPGAPFVFTVPNPGYREELSVPRILRKIQLKSLAQTYENWFMKMSRTYNLFDEKGWRDRLQKADFELVESRSYFSPSALKMLEWGHYFGTPSLFSRWLTGRWILSPTKWNLGITERVVRRYFDETPNQNGTYTFYLARRH